MKNRFSKIISLLIVLTVLFPTDTVNTLVHLNGFGSKVNTKAGFKKPITLGPNFFVKVVNINTLPTVKVISQANNSKCDLETQNLAQNFFNILNKPANCYNFSLVKNTQNLTLNLEVRELDIFLPEILVTNTSPKISNINTITEKRTNTVNFILVKNYQDEYFQKNELFKETKIEENIRSIKVYNVFNTNFNFYKILLC